MSKKHFQFKDLQTRQTRSHKFTTAFLLSKDDELLLIGVHYFWQKQNKQKKIIFRLTTCHFFLQPEIRKCWCSWVAFLNESCNAQVQPSVISLISSVLGNFVHPPAFYPFVVPCKCFGLGSNIHVRRGEIHAGSVYFSEAVTVTPCDAQESRK